MAEGYDKVPLCSIHPSDEFVIGSLVLPEAAHEVAAGLMSRSGGGGTTNINFL